VDSAAHRQVVEQLIHALLKEVRDCAQPWERVHAQLDALEALDAIGSAHDADALALSLELELAQGAADGQRLDWAEQRLMHRQ
jgi:hypothetical protein